MVDSIAEGDHLVNTITAEDNLFKSGKLQKVNLEAWELDNLRKAIAQSVYESSVDFNPNDSDKGSQYLGDRFEELAYAFMKMRPVGLIDEGDTQEHKYIITQLKYVDDLRQKIIQTDPHAKTGWNIGAPDFLVLEQITSGRYNLVATVETKFTGANPVEENPAEAFNIDMPLRAERSFKNKKADQLDKAISLVEYLRQEVKEKKDRQIREYLSSQVGEGIESLNVPENVRNIYIVPRGQSLEDLTGGPNFRHMTLPFTSDEIRNEVVTAARTFNQKSR